MNEHVMLAPTLRFACVHIIKEKRRHLSVCVTNPRFLHRVPRRGGEPLPKSFWFCTMEMVLSGAFLRTILRTHRLVLVNKMKHKNCHRAPQNHQVLQLQESDILKVWWKMLHASCSKFSQLSNSKNKTENLSTVDQVTICNAMSFLDHPVHDILCVLITSIIWYTARPKVTS